MKNPEIFHEITEEGKKWPFQPKSVLESKSCINSKRLAAKN